VCVCARVCVCGMKYEMAGGGRGKWECGKRGRALCRFSVCSSSTTSSPVVVFLLLPLLLLVPVFAFYRSVNDHIVYTTVALVCVSE